MVSPFGGYGFKAGTRASGSAGDRSEATDERRERRAVVLARVPLFDREPQMNTQDPVDKAKAGHR